MDYYHQILWIDTGFHCGECLEVLLDDEWVQTRMEMNPGKRMVSCRNTVLW